MPPQRIANVPGRFVFLSPAPFRNRHAVGNCLARWHFPNAKAGKGKDYSPFFYLLSIEF